MIGNMIPFTDPNIMPVKIDNSYNMMNLNYFNGIPLQDYMINLITNTPMTNQVIPPVPFDLQQQGSLIHY